MLFTPSYRLGVLATSTLALALTACAPPVTPAGAQREVTVGALLSLTGDWSTLGKASNAALTLAAEAANQQFAAANANLKVKVEVSDTKLLADTALSQLQAMAAKGIKTVIGPQSSAEVRALKPYADSMGILSISQGSTASTLAVDDNVIRFCPSDAYEGVAIAALMRADGIKEAVSLYQGSEGNTGLQTTVKSNFVAQGGVATVATSYEAGTTDFGPKVAELAVAVRAAKARQGNAAAVGVFLASFDEAVPIMKLAKADPELASVRWYGADGTAKSDVLANDAAAAGFAAQVGFPSPTFGLNPATQTTWQPVATQIHQQSTIEPDGFALAAYDALRVAAQAHQAAGPNPDVAALKAAFVTQANGYTGLTGSTRLDASGDRLAGNYDFWGLKAQGDRHTWGVVSRYVDGQVTRP